jgi:hypothetical protein
MLTDERVFLAGERAGLARQLFGDTDLSDVMQLARETEILDGVIRQAHHRCDRSTHGGDAL